MEASAAAVATAVLAVGLPASTAPAEDGVKVGAGAGADHRQMRGLIVSLEVLPTSHAAYPARAIARAAEASPQIV